MHTALMAHVKSFEMKGVVVIPMILLTGVSAKLVPLMDNVSMSVHHELRIHIPHKENQKLMQQQNNYSRLHKNYKSNS